MMSGVGIILMCFPDLFKISNDMEAYVANLMQFLHGVLFWDLEFL